MSAVAPRENALRSANTPTAPATVAALGSGSTSTPTDGQPPRQSTTPTAIIAMIATMKPYVGIANNVPDSLVPRRFIIVMNATNRIERKTLWWLARGYAEPIANTPATIETTTVIM